jgi:hypothetical protein
MADLLAVVARRIVYLFADTSSVYLCYLPFVARQRSSSVVGSISLFTSVARDGAAEPVQRLGTAFTQPIIIVHRALLSPLRSCSNPSRLPAYCPFF